MNNIIVLVKPTTKQTYIFDFNEIHIIYRNEAIRIGDMVQEVDTVINMGVKLGQMLSLGWQVAKNTVPNAVTKAALADADEIINRRKFTNVVEDMGVEYYNDPNTVKVT